MARIPECPACGAAFVGDIQRCPACGWAAGQPPPETDHEETSPLRRSVATVVLALVGQTVTVLARETGEVQWSATEQLDYDEHRVTRFQQDGDRLYRLSPNEFVALDATSGREIWTLAETIGLAQRIEDQPILLGDRDAIWILDPPF